MIGLILGFGVADVNLNVGLGPNYWRCLYSRLFCFLAEACLSVSLISAINPKSFGLVPDSLHCYKKFFWTIFADSVMEGAFGNSLF
jgi:hypothetical protein